MMFYAILGLIAGIFTVSLLGLLSAAKVRSRAKNSQTIRLSVIRDANRAGERGGNNANPEAMKMAAGGSANQENEIPLARAGR